MTRRTAARLRHGIVRAKAFLPFISNAPTYRAQMADATTWQPPRDDLARAAYWRTIDNALPWRA